VRTRLATLAAVAALVALAASGCTRRATQLIVVVETDLVAGTDYDCFGILVSRLDAAGSPDPRATRQFLQVGVGEGRAQAPFSFGVTPPDGDARRRVEVAVEALDGCSDPGPMDRVVRRAVRTGFLPEQSLRVPLFLPLSCGDGCAQSESCPAVGPDCVPIPVVEPTELAPTTPGEELVDAATALDAGIEREDAPGLDAPGADAPGLDAPAPDAGGVDAAGSDASTGACVEISNRTELRPAAAIGTAMPPASMALVAAPNVAGGGWLLPLVGVPGSASAQWTPYGLDDVSPLAVFFMPDLAVAPSSVAATTLADGRAMVLWGDSADDSTTRALYDGIGAPSTNGLVAGTPADGAAVPYLGGALLAVREPAGDLVVYEVPASGAAVERAREPMRISVALGSEADGGALLAFGSASSCRVRRLGTDRVLSSPSDLMMPCDRVAIGGLGDGTAALLAVRVGSADLIHLTSGLASMLTRPLGTALPTGRAYVLPGAGTSLRVAWRGDSFVYTTRGPSPDALEAAETFPGMSLDDYRATRFGERTLIGISGGRSMSFWLRCD